MEGGPAIHHGSSRPHPTHVDTCFLRPILLNRDADPDLQDAARRLVRRADGGYVCASVGALGEVWLRAEPNENDVVLSAADLESMASALGRLVRQGRLVLCGLGKIENAEGFYELARDVRRANDRIGDLDVMIVASALACPESEVFYTSDQPILVSSELRALAKEHGVRIEDPTSSRAGRRRS